MRTSVLRAVARKDSYYHADHTIVAEIALHGPFHQVPDWLYFRRDHDGRAERSSPTMRSRCVNMDPRRADRLRHPAIRLYGEYVWGYVAAVHRAPLSGADRRACYRVLSQWLVSRARSGSVEGTLPESDVGHDLVLDELVAGRGPESQEWR
jgi:LmbE family N-acetylglucosaminyl deacetylase